LVDKKGLTAALPMVADIDKQIENFPIRLLPIGEKSADECPKCLVSGNRICRHIVIDTVFAKISNQLIRI